MATETIKKLKGKQKRFLRLIGGDRQFLSPVKPVVFSIEKENVFISKAFHENSRFKPFVMTDFFLQQAEDMGKFLDKNPVPDRD